MTEKNKQVETKELIRQLAVAFIDRAEALNLKGKKRDDAVLDFFTGAALGLALAEKIEESTAVYRVTGLFLTTRGYKELERLTKETVYD